MNARTMFWAHFGFNVLVVLIAAGGFYLATGGGGTATSFAIGAVAELLIFAFVWWRWGGCPFTQREKRLLASEGQPVYEGPFLCHYAQEWLGIPLSELGADLVSVIVILLPAAGAAISLL